MNNHIFIPSSKKDISYCKICQLISYKGIISQSLPIKCHPRINMDPLTLKFVSFSSVANKKSGYHLKYLSNKRRGVNTIISLINTFGLRSMIFYKSISLLDQIFLNNEISIDNIETIALVCVLLVVEFNECCIPYKKVDFFDKNEKDIIFHTFNNDIDYNNKLNLRGLFLYIKNNVNNFNYWQILCLKYLNYDLGKYSAYDYLLLFFRLGILFCKETVDIISKLKICLKILDSIINDNKSCFFSQYTLAMSIINVTFGQEKYFDKNIFKIIYGVDLSKKKYINCSNMIKNVILYYNNNNSNNFICNNNNKLTNSPNQISIDQSYQNSNNFNNYNYMNNFAYNFYNNNIQDSLLKKRNSMFLTSEPQVQRRSSHTSIPNIQMINSDKKLKKINIEKEENPNYFLKDQLYCRQIQNKLDKNINNLKYSDEFYENIKFQLVEIIEHQFGNYVIQKFLNVLLFQENKKLYKLIFLDINSKLFEICIHNYGTRVIQKTLEKLDNKNYYKIETNELNDVFKNLIENHLYELCCDKNGNHVYQKLLRVFPKERNQFLYDSLIKISFPVSIIQQGATLLQTAFDYSTKEQQEKLCTVIINRIADLINDKYGNYTIQTIFKLYNDKINDRIYEYIN